MKILNLNGALIIGRDKEWLRNGGLVGFDLRTANLLFLMANRDSSRSCS
jgi:hypothetical protein